jgi:hypothetical protein
MCLNKLLNFKLILPTSLDDSLTQHEKLEALISFNRILGKYDLQSFQHRFVTKIFNFSYKIINSPLAPIYLRNTLQDISNLKKEETRTLRNGKTTTYETTNRSQCNTFDFFYERFFRNLVSNQFSLEFMSFKSTISHSLDNLLANFITIFPRFDLNYSTYVHYKKKAKKKH